jgi:hypothetical protein
MRLVALVALGCLALSSVGCMAQVGDPSTEETQRPEEIVAVSGTARPITTVAAPVVAPPEPSGSHATNVGGGSTLPAGNSMNPGSSTTIADDNPNPSPWDGHNNPGNH